MQKILLFVCLLMANFAFAQVVDSTTIKKTTKTTTTVKTITTIVTTEPIDSLKLAKPAKKAKKTKEEDEDKDTPTDKKNIIKTNLTSFFLATFHLSYERVINQKVTLQLGAYYSFYGNGIFGGNDGAGLRGFGITPEIRYYPNGVAPIGFFVGISPRFQYYIDEPNFLFGGTGPEVRTAIAGAAIIVGRQWLVGDSISIDLYFGPSINGVISKEISGNNNNNNNGNFDTTFPYTRPVGFRFGVTVGFAF